MLLAAISLAVSANSLANGFVYDDSVLVLRNRWITDVSYIPEIFRSGAWGFYNQTTNYYRPITHLVYMLDYRLFGFAPWGFHLVNLLIHAAICILVFMVTEKLVSNLYVSFLTAAIFAVHPVHTEVVAWVSCTPDTTFVFFYLLSLYLYMVSRDKAGRSGKIAFATSVAAYFISMLCKEPAVTLPGLLIVYDYLTEGRKGLASDRLRQYIPYLLAFCVYLAIRVYALGGFAPNTPHAGLGSYEALLNVFPLFAGYLLKLVLPLNLSAFYVFHPVHSALGTAFIIPAIITACFGLALYLSLRKRSAAAFGLALVALPLLPSLYIPAVGKNVFAERYLYLPAAGFGLVVSLLALRAAARKPVMRRAIYACLAAALVLYASGSIARNTVWKDNYMLWSDAVRKAPDGAIPHDSLGVALFAMGRVDQAIAEHEQAVRLGGEGTRAHANLGNAYLAKGMLERAAAEYGAELKAHPADRTAHNGLGVAYGKMGRFDQAAIEADPNYTEARKNLALAYRKMGDAKKKSGP